MSWGVSLVVVTGASRGLGACLCRELALRVAPGSVILGTSRSLQDMELQRPLLEARGIKVSTRTLRTSTGHSACQYRAQCVPVQGTVRTSTGHSAHQYRASNTFVYAYSNIRKIKRNFLSASSLHKLWLNWGLSHNFRMNNLSEWIRDIADNMMFIS